MIINLGEVDVDPVEVELDFHDVMERVMRKACMSDIMAELKKFNEAEYEASVESGRTIRDWINDLGVAGAMTAISDEVGMGLLAATLKDRHEFIEAFVARVSLPELLKEVGRRIESAERDGREGDS